MLLFTDRAAGEPAGSWIQKRSFDEREAGLVLDVGIDVGCHSVSVQAVADGQLTSELVGPASVASAGEPVSNDHLPPHHRWERGALSCRFAAEWRDSAPSLTVSLRHMQSLRSHRRALVVDDPERREELGGSPAGCIVMSAARTVDDLLSGEPQRRMEWRGWHVVAVDDPFEGPRRRVLATHTEVWW